MFKTYNVTSYRFYRKIISERSNACRYTARVESNTTAPSRYDCHRKGEEADENSRRAVSAILSTCKRCYYLQFSNRLSLRRGAGNSIAIQVLFCCSSRVKQLTGFCFPHSPHFEMMGYQQFLPSRFV